MKKLAWYFRNAVAALLVFPTIVLAVPGDLADGPLYLTSAVDPNLMFIIDDSGSMHFEYIPDSIGTIATNYRAYMFPQPSGVYGSGDYAARLCDGSPRLYFVPTFDDSNAHNLILRSSANNAAFYNPDIEYTPWVNNDGSARANADPEAAYWNPENTALGSLNLLQAKTATAHWFTGANANTSDVQGSPAFYCGGSEKTYWPITYYKYNSGDKTLIGSYTKVEITASTADSATFTSPAGIVRTKAEEVQNFANWFQYYRSRVLAARSGIGKAFAQLPSNIRVGYGAINKGTSSVDGVDTATVVNGLRAFTGDDRTNFFNLLYGRSIPTSGTPLRTALKAVGEYYKRTDDKGPWSRTPGTTNTAAHLECRQSFSILMTDGYWSGSSPDVGNADNEDGLTITSPNGESYKYTPKEPFKDDVSNTLADVAMTYWKQDLRTDLDNLVPASDDNPAFWQHMVTYGVGLGVSGSVDAEDAFNAIDAETDVSWGSTSTDAGKLDDLLHAAVNSRGGFFSAADPDAFATELADVLVNILEAVGSSSGITFNTATLESDSLLFGARFDSSRWSGELGARALIENEGAPPTVSPTPAWEAGAVLDARNLATDPRAIITYSGSAGVPFRWDSLNAAQKSDLQYNGDETLGQNRLAYLRGDRSLENGTFRSRDSRLGDIVNSTPVYVAAPGQPWPDIEPFGATTDRYSSFRFEQRERRPMVYVGANDGMLHGFAANNTQAEGGGSELFAYVPEAVFSADADKGLHYLTDSAYQHRFYVDLPVMVVDAYIEGPNSQAADWRTVLVSGSRSGAKGIFALDITNPANFSEANASSIALWEFTGEDDSRMGYITEPPIITMAKWGNNDYRWTAFLGNGYNAATAGTGMFMLDLEGGLDGIWSSGTDYRYISFDSAGSGLSPVRVLYAPGTFIADRVYAGDLSGNIWVASVSGNGTWASAYGSGNTAVPLFTANYTDATGTTRRQPITAAPMVIPHEATEGDGYVPNYLVLFGTGQYLTPEDPTNVDVQSFYGVLDKGVTALNRTLLENRTLSESTLTIDSVVSEVRFANGDDVAWSQQAGWYVDFNTELGERIVLSPQIRGKYAFVNSMVPSSDPCEIGGGGWLMAFGLDGRTPDRAVFKRFGEPVVGFKVKGGLPNKQNFLGDFMLTPLSNSEIVTEEIDVGGDEDKLGRLSWQELIN